MAAQGDVAFPRISNIDPATKAGLVDGKHIQVTLVPPTDTTHSLSQVAFKTPALTVYKSITPTTRTVDIAVWSGPPLAAGDSDPEVVATARGEREQEFVSFYRLK